jgi:hypothetical protein
MLSPCTATQSSSPGWTVPIPYPYCGARSHSAHSFHHGPRPCTRQCCAARCRPPQSNHNGHDRMLACSCSWYARAEIARNVVIANAFEVQLLCSLGEFSPPFLSCGCSCLPLATVTTNVFDLTSIIRESQPNTHVFYLHPCSLFNTEFEECGDWPSQLPLPAFTF